MIKTDKATIIKAVEKIETLRKNGVTALKAREIVAGDFNESVYKVTQWHKTHGPTRKVSRVKTTKSNVVVSNSSIKGLNDLNVTLFDTVESLKEGRITHKEACAMSSLAGTITNIKKLQFAGLKYASKVSNKETTVTELLGQ